MQRKPKSFSIEIKKSRVPGHQRHSLPPRSLFEPAPVEAPKSFERKEPDTTSKPVAAPRILPSIVAPLWSDVEPDSHKSSLGSGTGQDQMELNLNACALEAAKGATEETFAISDVLLQADAAIRTGEAASSVPETQVQEAGRTEAKSRRPRKKVLQTPELTAAPDHALQAEQEPEAKVINSLRPEEPLGAGNRRLTKRQTAAAQLPRYEHWKRRLHPAAW